MSLVESANGFTYTWTIDNYNFFAVKKGKYLCSPKFQVNCVKDVKFYFKVQRVPKGTDFVGFYICKEKLCSEDVLCDLSIYKLNGLLESQNANEFKGLDLSCGFPRFVVNAELVEPNYPYSTLDLTLSCRIWSRDVNIPVSISRFVHTIVKTTEINYTWEIDNALTSNRTCKINQSFNISTYSPELPSCEVSVSNADDSENIVFAIQCITSKSFFIVYTVNILHSNGNQSRPIHGQCLFGHSNGNQSFAFPLVPTRRLLSNKRLYLKNNKLTVCCDFIISTNEYGGVSIANVDCASKRSLESSDSDQVGLFSLGAAQDDHGYLKQTEQRLANKLIHAEDIWTKGWKRIVQEKEFSDLIIRTPRKQFPVHKAVLFSHSEVFYAMLKHDMKEQNSGVIDIEDLEDDTIDKILQYLYMGRVDNMDCSTAHKLYFAADKYEIAGLLNLCSTYLESHLDASNVCHILVLADTHQDQQLKSCAEDFIVKHASEIIDSEDWKEIMDTHLQLSAITMKRIISNNLNG